MMGSMKVTRPRQLIANPPFPSYHSATVAAAGSCSSGSVTIPYGSLLGTFLGSSLTAHLPMCRTAAHPPCESAHVLVRLAPAFGDQGGPTCGHPS